MHADEAEIRKSIRSYLKIGAALFVFTAITVAVNQVHLVVPLAITVALVIAVTKGSMVASIFMHLTHEKQWIYGALALTVLFFVILLALPILSIKGGIGVVPPHPMHAAAGEHGGH